MTLLLDDEAVRGVLHAPELVDAIELAVKDDARSPAVVPERMNLLDSNRFLRVMPAIVPSAGVMGLKVFHGGAGAGVRYMILLSRIETGEVLAAMDACFLTAARTAATSVVASRVIAGQGRRLGVLGSGLEAETHIQTFLATGEVDLVKLYSPSADNQQRLAARLRRSLDVEIVACATPEEACCGIDHLITATNTGNDGPVACFADWLSPNLHISAIGSTHERLRELDTEVLRRAGGLVFDADPAQIATESGDIRAFIDEGGTLSDVVTLSQLLQGTATLPSDPRAGYTVFKSVGTAMQDMVAAELAYRTALDAGVGVRVPELATPKTRR